MKGGKKVEEETKKPCTPVEEAGRDYNELGLYLHSKENNRTLEAAQTLWEFLPGWMAAREMAVYDPDYNRSLSGVIAENAEIILKAAQDMAGWGQAECEPARKEETPQGYAPAGTSDRLRQCIADIAQSLCRCSGHRR